MKIELWMEDGRTVEHQGELRGFGTSHRFVFDGADHRHAVSLIARTEEKQRITVMLSYDRDGASIVADHEGTYAARRRQTLWTEDGKLAIALTFYPTNFE